MIKWVCSVWFISACFFFLEWVSYQSANLCSIFSFVQNNKYYNLISIYSKDWGTVEHFYDGTLDCTYPLISMDVLDPKSDFQSNDVLA